MNRWDKYFLGICDAIAENSKCLSRKIGAIIVEEDRWISATGYNGPPKGVEHCGIRHRYDDKLRKLLGIGWDDEITDICPRYIMGFKSGEGLDWCIAGHAERNAIVNAARRGVKINGSKMYMNCPTPCVPCLVEIINAGIIEVVCSELTIYEKNKSPASYLIQRSDLIVRDYEGNIFA